MTITPPDSTNTSPHVSPIGAEVIRAAGASLPASSGVYRMLNAAGEILYIGKAKQLKNRVGSYANINALSTRIMRMVSQVARVEWTVTKSEAEALLLEANLIKQHTPRYNILLKDDKSFPYLMFSPHAYPRIYKHRGSLKGKGEAFGPFASVTALNHTLALLQKVFLLRPCADTVFKHRTRPCLQYQIKRCSAPCVGYVSESEYSGQLALARDFLRGKSRAVQEIFTRQMQEASDALQFERAGQLRDRIRALTQVQQEQGLRAAGLTDADAIALYRHNTASCITVFFFRQGLNFGSQVFHPTHTEEASDAEVMEAFLGQFYHSRTPPKEILLSVTPENEAVINDALSLRVPYRVQFHVPKRGDKLQLLNDATAQAKAAYERRMMESSTAREQMDALAELCGILSPIRRIDVFDNSHIMGTHQLGAMIVATSEGFKKTAYRIFHRKQEETIAGDDLSMMREVMRRRFRGLAPQETQVMENDANDDITVFPDLPDLLLVDGGLTQLNVVCEVLKEYGLESLPVLSIAKGEHRNAGREWFFMQGRAPFQIEKGNPLLHYLERLRDEAHRFAIGSHRNKRSKALTRSALDDIGGIGAKRKKALLMHFGSRAGVEAATLAELQKVEGINTALAEQIFAYFHR
jgi:excinuclease ABC subunit C